MTTYAIPEIKKFESNLMIGGTHSDHFNSVIARYKTPSNLRFRWGIYQDKQSAPIANGQATVQDVASRMVELLKLERQYQERLAGVSLDSGAQKLLSVLDRETSIKWEDIPDGAEGDWSEMSRAIALLAGANLCEASPTRLRLSECGVRLLAELSSDEQAGLEVAV